MALALAVEAFCAEAAVLSRVVAACVASDDDDDGGAPAAAGRLVRFAAGLDDDAELPDERMDGTPSGALSAGRGEVGGWSAPRGGGGGGEDVVEETTDCAAEVSPAGAEAPSAGAGERKDAAPAGNVVPIPATLVAREVDSPELSKVATARG